MKHEISVTGVDPESLPELLGKFNEITKDNLDNEALRYGGFVQSGSRFILVAGEWYEMRSPMDDVAELSTLVDGTVTYIVMLDPQAVETVEELSFLKKHVFEGGRLISTLTAAPVTWVGE